VLASEPSAPTTRRQAVLARAVLGAGVAVYLALSLASLRHLAPVFDETAQFPAGYSYWRFGDFRLNPEHPPLVKRLAAVPLLFMDVTARADEESWRNGEQWGFGRRFLYSWNDGPRLLLLGRLAVVPLGCLMAAAVFSWAVRLWGLAGGSLALLLCATSPDILAHGHLVTFDVGVSLFIFLTVIAFERLTRRVTWRRLLAAGLSLGAAFAAKESALGLLPILALLAAWTIAVPEPILLELPGRAPKPVAERKRRAAVLALLLLAMGATALAVIWTVYGFQARLPAEAAAAGMDWKRAWPARAAVGSAASLVKGLGLLPEAYLYGLLDVFRYDARGNVFLMGRIAPSGFVTYYPLAFLIKTPLALLVLVGASLLLLRRQPLPPRSEGFLWLPLLVYGGLVMTRHVQNGHRHLLPLYPFLFVAAGRVAAWAARLDWSKPARPLVIALASWHAFDTLRVAPHYIGYFNELVGGPEQGYRYLVDSDLDWGQDLERLKAYTDASHIPRIKLSYFGTAEPGFYGIPCDLLPSYKIGHPGGWRVEPGDIVAVSATNLQGIYLPPDAQPLMERLRRLEPIARVGYSIFIYRADFALSHP
jgi:dolichyl-phosphate-mannose-protein mannosyltransferase